MADSARFELASREIALKAIDDRAIAINLETGLYYSTEKAGAFILEMLVAGASIGQVASTTVARYDISITQARFDVESLVLRLLEEQLIKRALPPAELPNVVEDADARMKLSYERPELAKFTDMAQFFATEPVPTRSRAFALSSENVIAKVMDGEAIIINLDNGFYYSIDGAGAFIWQGLMSESSIEEIASALEGHYEVPREQAIAAVEALVGRLIDESIIRVLPKTAPSDWPEEREPEQRVAWTAPELLKFTDMVEHFALDPPLPVVAPLVPDSNQKRGDRGSSY